MEDTEDKFNETTSMGVETDPAEDEGPNNFGNFLSVYFGKLQEDFEIYDFETPQSRPNP
jgi:hypothetical protein